MKNSLFTSAFAAIALATGGLASIPASATSVQPVILDLTAAGRQMSALVQVQNTFQQDLPVEIRANVAAVGEDGLSFTEETTDDLLIFPPQALIPPGQTQSFRVQYVGDPDMAQSKHYYLTVAQLPVKLAEGQTAVQVLYNFQVIVSVGVAGARSDISVRSAEVDTSGEDGKPRLVINAENASNTYGYLADGTLRVVQRNAAGEEIFRQVLSRDQIAEEIGYGLVGAGQKRRLVTSLELPEAGGVIEAEYTPSRGR